MRIDVIIDLIDPVQESVEVFLLVNFAMPELSPGSISDL